ncbi:MAG: protein kinase, partial [Planctomycetales bacterium]|nr:protein kinase [Planctomycetales bacterium]
MTGIGPYEILEEIGRGGYGVVYRARHRGTSRIVALKVLVTPEGAEPVAAQRFLREIETARSLDHPGIVRVLDAGEESGRPWMALEMVEGRSLFEALRDEPLDWRGAATIARDLADALAYAHARGVLHRDVKPGNILVGTKVVSGSSSRVCRSEEAGSQPQTTNAKPQTAGPSAFLTDFGLAKLVETGSRLTRTGTAVGTPEYMSPEQARGEVHGLTPATDVWGVGVVLYEMLAGRRAFDGESPESVVEKVILAEPAPLRRLRADVPRGLARVVRVCLAKRPASRYRDGAALREDLDRVLRGERPRAWSPRAAPARGLLAALAVAAALAAWGAWGREPGWSAGLPPAVPLPLAGPAPSSEAEDLVARARSLRAADPRGAIERLGRALALAPDHPAAPGWRLERGLLSWSLGEGGAATAEWDRIPPESPESSAAGLYKALEALFRLGRAEPAWPELKRVASGQDRWAQLARGTMAALGEDWTVARGLLASEPGWDAALVRGYVESSNPAGDPRSAVREYTDALAGGIAFALVHNNRGFCRQTIGDKAGAEEDYDAAVRLAPSDVHALFNRAVLREHRGDHAGAVADFTTALRLRPEALTPRARRAHSRSRLGDASGAREDFQAVVSMEATS